jgi:peptidoglycan/LPS O-acetylase OafA/YrhL
MPLRNFFLVWVKGCSMEATVALYIGYYIASMAAAALVFHLWERPFMAKRDRLSQHLLRTA